MQAMLAKGKAVYAMACARCHGASAQQPGKAGSILDGSFLALINEQTIAHDGDCGTAGYWRAGLARSYCRAVR